MTSDSRPAQPQSILRGHKSQIHTAAFVRRNERLMTGDADGFVIAWDLTIMRPRAVWRAHSTSILGISGWGMDKVITHGRDNKLIVWKLGVDDEARMSTTLPLDPSSESRPEPWMLHMLEVNTMNFCSFSYCHISEAPDSEILLAVPNTLASEAIDIYHLPSQARRYTVKLGDKNGMVMALSISANGPRLTLIAGYENGIAIAAQFSPDTAQWTVKYQAKSHSQPILSLDMSPDKDFFITSGADAVIAKHPLPALDQSDGVAPGFSAQKTTNPQQPGPSSDPKGTADKKTRSLLSAALQNESSSVNQPALTASSNNQVQTEPLKTVNTKHSGQQSLRIRSDGRVFATAGWDNKVRVYSTKTLKELAVLKWHQAGCYAVAFAEIDSPDISKADSTETQEPNDQAAEEGTSALTVIPKLVELTVRDKRIKEAKSAHWLAAGSKDSKVSLWAVY